MGWSSGFGGGGEGGWGRGGDALSRELRPAGSHWLGGGATRQQVCVASRRWPDPGVSQQSAAGIGGGAASLRRGQHGGRRDLEGERGGGRRRGLRAGAARRGAAQPGLFVVPPPAAAAVVRGLLVGVEALPRAAARLPPLLRARGAAGLRPLAGRLRGLPRLGEGPSRRRAGTARAPAGSPSRCWWGRKAAAACGRAVSAVTSAGGAGKAGVCSG